MGETNLGVNMAKYKNHLIRMKNTGHTYRMRGRERTLSSEAETEYETRGPGKQSARHEFPTQGCGQKG